MEAGTFAPVGRLRFPKTRGLLSTPVRLRADMECGTYAAVTGFNRGVRMSVADDVRSFCISEYVEPARRARSYTVTIQAGDVHDSMEFSARQPLVCAALGSETFDRGARVRRLAIDGPINGANTLFVCRLRE